MAFVHTIYKVAENDRLKCWGLFKSGKFERTENKKKIVRQNVYSGPYNFLQDKYVAD